MHTKFEFVYSKPLEGQWIQLINVALPTIDIRNDFLVLLNLQYGLKGDRYSIRWADAGADVRFLSESDAASFIMLYTCKAERLRKYPPQYHHII
jgi:hypothetical protein